MEARVVSEGEEGEDEVGKGDVSEVKVGELGEGAGHIWPAHHHSAAGVTPLCKSRVAKDAKKQKWKIIRDKLKLF